MDMDRRFRQLQRATVARSALDVIALIFLCCGFAFWAVAFWQLLAPPALLSLLTIQACVLALVYSLAAPLLLSMLVPTTPAGQLLQKTQWRTIGFPVIIAGALYLTYQAGYMLEAWLSAQPAIADAGMARSLAISMTIALIVIPALSWVQLTPERWLAQIQQAHAVKKLELQQRGELAIVKASLLRAERLAIKGWANLLPLEQEEVFSTMRGLLMSSSDVQRDIVRTLDLSAELEREIMSDQVIADRLDHVARALDVLPEIAPAADRAAHQDAAPVSPAAPPPPRPAASHSESQRYAVEYDTASQMLHGVWSVHALGDVLGMAERTARDRLNAWIAHGLVAPSDTKGKFYFTESAT
ncbi:MAG TPA: hypothetical protein VNM70_07455 [Burkholderiales bacterium]|nr:hypothetical protein [Burkholderiales bacterium]